jgi:hypothetical protein
MNRDDLADLGVQDVSPEAAERIRRRAQRILLQERASLAQLWSRILEPALVVGVVGVYLIWAFTFVARLRH